MSERRYSKQDIDNVGADHDFNGFPMRELIGFDGQTLQRMNADNLQIYHLNSGGYDYFCFASPGTALATDKWRIFRLDSDANLVYADGNANYDNIASDPTLLTYSYS